MRILGSFKKRPDGPAEHDVALAHEPFQPDDLPRRAQEAERAGFDGVACSDTTRRRGGRRRRRRRAPATRGPRLGAVAQATTRARLGPAVTAIVHRYNPVVAAQQIATLDILAPGRVFLGVGSGEAMNEVPAGTQRPAVEEQLARTEAALTIITKLLDVVVQAVFSYAPTDEEALERNGADAVPDELSAKQVICSADPATHVERIRAIERLGADGMCLTNVSGPRTARCAAIPERGFGKGASTHN